MTTSSDADDGPRVPIICPECETEARIPLADVADRLEKHNERLHDGKEVAEVDPDVKEGLADIVADEMGLLESSE
ncbi:hypothetical protein ACYJ1Y_04520 [Natrialbaceae archaeon A-gly3]